MAISSLMEQQQQQQQSNHSDEEQVDELDDDEYHEPYQGNDNHRNASILNHQNTAQQRKRSRRRKYHDNIDECDNSRITKRRDSISSNSNSSIASNDLLRILNQTCHSSDNGLSTSSTTDHHASSVDSILADSFIEINGDKEPNTRKRSTSNHQQHVFRYYRGKRNEEEQLLIEKESRIRAKAELVKHLMKAGFSQEEITEQLGQLQ